MRRTAFFFGFVAPWLWAGALHAQSPSTNACAQIESELVIQRARAEQLEQTLGSLEGTIAELRAAEARLGQAVAAAEQCRAERQEFCTATQNFAKGLAQGRLDIRELSRCIGPEPRRALVDQLSGWRNATSALTELGNYAAGVTDRPPHLAAPHGTPIEAVVSDLLAESGKGGTPRVYRRLLVEAMTLVAPRAWERLRERGPDELEAWFASTEPLEPELFEEAQRGAEVQAEGGALSTALSMVHVYQRLAHCHEPQPATHACARAEQLAHALESNGPLLLRRRTQDIWSTDCSVLDPEVLLGWIRDLPGMAVGSQMTEPGRTIVLEATSEKLYTCFLRDPEAGASFEAWRSQRWPRAEQLNARELALLDALRTRTPDAVEPRCAEAVRALQLLEAPNMCALPADTPATLATWTSQLATTSLDGLGPEARICARFARALWEGRAVTIPPTFANAPAIEDVLVPIPTAPPTAIAVLRQHCALRAGPEEAFPARVRELAEIAQGFGENPASAPWSLDPRSLEPVEEVRLEGAQTFENWLGYLVGRTSSCAALDMNTARCEQCRGLPGDAHFDCTVLARLERTWTRDARHLTLAALGLVALLLFARWLTQLLRIRREFGTWSRDTIESLADLGIPLRADPLRWVFPSRFQVLIAELPAEPAWERWGKRAVLLRASRGRMVHARDVNRTAQLAHVAGAEFALLVHDTGTSLDLSAVRAVLEWAAKGGTRAVHVLPISSERLQWSRGPDDLLDLVEEGSLRQNPFEVRGRIQSSQQFFNRERLVSGLLASVQAGHFTVVTGLRRFGKSSLALEVGRRSPGPTAYVDLAGFHDEFGSDEDPGRAADAVLRYLCVQLNDAAAHRYPGAALPPPPGAETRMDATTLATWFRDFGAACSTANADRSTTLLVILDELEQAIAVGAERLEHALTVLAVVIGRLRNAVPASGLSQSSTRIGMLLCSAIDPLLWAPLGTLAHQSLMGSFCAVCVPCLPEEAAVAMMRGLGARHGIRFTDAAIELIVQQAQGIPLLVRRIGSAVLELYDPERARQGSLGAVEIGIEGATTAIEREEQEGSPLRVWIESEIASPQSPAGTVLRKLAVSEACAVEELRALTTEHIRERFAETGVEGTLSAGECQRRAEEASGVLLRLLHESGLLVAHGDLTNPEAYALPDGVVRRVLAQAVRRGAPERTAGASRMLNGSPEISGDGAPSPRPR